MILNKQTHLLFAAQNYTNLHCTSMVDFQQDLKLFITARTLLRLYHKSGKLKIRLLLNHIITCTNIFETRAVARLFFYYCEPELHAYLKTIFVYLNIMGDYNPEITIKNIASTQPLQNVLENL